MSETQKTTTGVSYSVGGVLSYVGVLSCVIYGSWAREEPSYRRVQTHGVALLPRRQLSAINLSARSDLRDLPKPEAIRSPCLATGDIARRSDIPTRKTPFLASLTACVTGRMTGKSNGGAPAMECARTDDFLHSSSCNAGFDCSLLQSESSHAYISATPRKYTHKGITRFSSLSTETLSCSFSPSAPLFLFL